MTSDPHCAEFLIDPIGGTVLGIKEVFKDLGDVPPAFDIGRLIALVRPEDIARVTPYLLEAGINPLNIFSSIHPEPGYMEIVEIPPSPSLRDYFSTHILGDVGE